MNVYQLLLEQASEQLDKLSSAVDKDVWFETLIRKLENEIKGADLDEATYTATIEALKVIADSKYLIIGLGAHAFTLLMYQLSLGKNAEATETYIRALTNADDLIALMNTTSDGVIKAKIELDRLQADSKELILNILSIGARNIIPFLLNLL